MEMDDVVAAKRAQSGERAAADVLKVLAAERLDRDGPQVAAFEPNACGGIYVDLVPEPHQPGTNLVEHLLDPTVVRGDPARADHRYVHGILLSHSAWQQES